AGLAHADAIDIEIASTALATELVPRARAAGRTVILSAHAMDATPPADALLPLVDRAEAMGADVTKLAATARDIEDVRTMLAVTLAARIRYPAVVASTISTASDTVTAKPGETNTGFTPVRVRATTPTRWPPSVSHTQLPRGSPTGPCSPTNRRRAQPTDGTSRQ